MTGNKMYELRNNIQREPVERMIANEKKNFKYNKK